MKKLSGLLAIVLLLSMMLTSCNRDPKESGGDSSTNNPVSMAGPDENAVDALDFSGVFDNDFFEGYEKMDLDVSKAYYTLLSVANHLTWSIQVGGTTAGSALTLTPFVHNIGQVFEIQEVEGGNIVLKSLATGLVIAAKDTEEGSALQLEEYAENADNQLWSKKTASNGYFTLVNKKSGKAINSANAAGLTQTATDGSTAQEWEIAPIDVKEMVDPAVPDTGSKENWAKNAIRYPEEGQLVGAGPIYLQWYQNKAIGDVRQYEVVFDEEEPVIIAPSDASIIGYEWYNVQVAKHTVTVTAVLQDGTRVPTDKRNFTVTKKGIGWGTLHRIEDMQLSWYYNWHSVPSAGMSQNVEFVPMIWGNSADLGLDKLVKQGYKTVLGFNEPDAPTQANVTVENAVAAWSKFTESGLRLGSPCTAAHAPNSLYWFYPFMEDIRDAGMDVDYVVMHMYYDQTDIDGFLETLDLAWKIWKKPIWITEFALANFGNASPWGGGVGDPAEAYAFMEKLLPELDKREYVERYAWYPFGADDPYGGVSALFDYSTGELTKLGELYNQMGLPK